MGERVVRSKTLRANRAGPNRALLALATAAACSAFPLSAVLWVHFGEKPFSASAFLAGLSLGPCLAAYGLVATRHKQFVRKMVLLSGGLSILSLPLLGRVNVDLEAFFMLLLLGSGGAAIGHTMVTVIAGPIIFGRVLCGWGCWRAMALEWLPIRGSPGRRGGYWGMLPYCSLLGSVAIAGFCVFVRRESPGGTPGMMHTAGLGTSATIVALYYAASIALGFAMKDARAFCKYACPSAAILKVTSRLAVFKMTANRALCDACGACSRVCPMDIDVARCVIEERHVGSGECILCQRCAQACPASALRLAARFGSRGGQGPKARGHE